MEHTFAGFEQRNQQSDHWRIPDTHVREVIADEQLWQAVTRFVSQQVRQDNMTNQEWFIQNWAQDSSNIANPLNRLIINRTLEIYFNLRMVRLLCEATALLERYPDQSVIPPDYAQDPEYVAARQRIATMEVNTSCVVSDLSIDRPHQIDACKVCVKHCALRMWNEASFQEMLTQNNYAMLVRRTLEGYNLYAGIDGHISRALAYLQGENGAIKRDSAFTADVTRRYSIESLLTAEFTTIRTLDLEVERMTRHAKTNINYETLDAQNIIETRHVILNEPAQSALRSSFERRQFVSIAGGDPYNLAVVRTNHMLQRADFPTCSDVRIKFSQIAHTDRSFIEINAFADCYRTHEPSDDVDAIASNVAVFVVGPPPPTASSDSNGDSPDDVLSPDDQSLHTETTSDDADADLPVDDMSIYDLQSDITDSPPQGSTTTNDTGQDGSTLDSSLEGPTGENS
jgi:hypothetical protein